MWVGMREGGKKGWRNVDRGSGSDEVEGFRDDGNEKGGSRSRRQTECDGQTRYM